MALGVEHSILRGLREPRNEPELTRVLAAIFVSDPALAAAFVKTVLRHSKRPDDRRWQELPERFDCRSEVQIAEGRVDLEFSDAATGWRVLVELKIDAGYGFEQIKRYLNCVDAADDRQVLVSVTRDVPKYGDPPTDGQPNWCGSVSWNALLDDLRDLCPSDTRLEQQWPLFLDVLENEGSMGVTKVKPELLRAWAQATDGRRHAVAFMENLRYPLLLALQEALEPSFPSLERDERASVAPAPSRGQRPQVDVQFFVPRGDEMHVAAQLWAWEDFRFAVSARYPSEDRSPEAKEAIATLARARFENWNDRWLWRSRPLSDELLARPDLPDELLTWARESFDHIAASGILRLAAAPLPPEAEDDEF